MPRTHLILLALSLAIAPLAMGAGPVPPQDDGASGGDAANVCTDAVIDLEVDGDALDGELYPPQDSKDYYQLIVDADDVGDDFTVSISGHHDMTVDVFTPDCGRNVVAQSANGETSDGTWHVHDDGAGHDHCDIAGHSGDAACDTENGEADEFGQSVTFTPSQEGSYYARVSIAPNAEHPEGGGKRLPPGDSVVIFNCHTSCMSYTLASARDAPTDTEIS